MSTLVKDEQRLVWEARKLWAKRGDVRVTIDRTAIVSPIVGTIERVSVTGAFIVVDGWHVPMYAVKAFGKPTYGDREDYLERVKALAQVCS